MSYSVNEQDLTDKGKRRPNVSIREMDIDDIPPVFHLGERLFTAKEVPNLYRTWDEYEVIGMFQDDPEFSLVAEVDEKIVGFALGTTIIKSRSAWKYGHLVWLGVDPDYQGYGIATKLFNALRELMVEEGVRILVVDTEADNDAALEFFRKMGFGNPEEQVYLTLNIDSQRRPSRERNHDGRNHV
jgi:ribosomal protein S18 acetylase RimI-like enzyme